jgi:drug/metabolite transporter (DMT)-like permease
MFPQVVLNLITVLWGTSFLVVQTALKWASPFTVVGLRFGLAGLIFAAVMNRRLGRFSRQDAVAGMAMGWASFWATRCRRWACRPSPAASRRS